MSVPSQSRESNPAHRAEAGQPQRLRLLAILEATSITGPAKNLLQFAEFGASSGVDTHIATFVRGADNLFTKRVEEMGIPLHRIPEQRAFDPAVLRRLLEVAAEVQPDILQTHAVKSHFLARLAGLTKRYPWVAFHHGYTWTSRKTRAYNELDRWSLRAARTVLTVSKPFRDELAAKGVPLERIEVVHNAIAAGWGLGGRDPMHAAQLRATWRIPAEAKVLLIVGRLSLEKDHVALLRAVAGLACSQPLHLVIVGDGPERTSLESLAADLGINERVHFAGQQPTAEPFYGIADIAVLSSRTEGSPNALLEAMSAGVPAVATRVGGIPEIVEDGVTALLVPPGDADALRAAMQRLLDEPTLGAALASSASVIVQERHHPASRASRLADRYHEVLESWDRRA
ncbi:MAG: glycosyltransferase [Bryobacterales bacterium]|nr:glycosyltransferase [Bryobacterales bacterium]